MKDSFVGIVVAAVALVVFGGLYLVTPTLVSSDVSNAASAERSVAKAERLLDMYTANFATLDAVDVHLTSLDAPANIDAVEDLAAVLESDQLVKDVSTAIRQLGGAATSGNYRPPAGSVENLQQLGVPQRMVEAWFAAMGGFGQVDLARHENGLAPIETPGWVAAFGGSPNASQIKAFRQALVSARTRNNKLLDDALAAADAAIGEDPNNSRAQELRGMVFLNKAQLAQREAALKAGEAQPIRIEVLGLANLIDQLQQAEIDYLERRRLDDSIADAEQQQSEVQNQLAEALLLREGIAGELGALQTQVDLALNQLNQARNQLDALTDNGFDKARYGSFASYQSAVASASQNWRQKAVNYQVLSEGTVDENGKALMGIAPRKRDLKLADEFIKQLTEQAAEAEDAVRAMHELKAQLDEVSRARLNELERRRSEIQALLDQESRLSAEARAAEEAVMERISPDAMRSFKMAQQAASSRSRREGVSQDIAAKLQGDTWLNASMLAEQASASLQAASAAVQRIADLHSRRQMVEAIEQAGVGELTVAAIDTQIEEARAIAVEATDRALEDAQKAQRIDNEWFYEGLIGAIHMTAWLADPDQPERKATAIASFEDAINGREESVYAAPYRRVLDGLRAAGT